MKEVTYGRYKAADVCDEVPNIPYCTCCGPCDVCTHCVYADPFFNYSGEEPWKMTIITECKKCAYWQNVYCPTLHEVEINKFGGYTCGERTIEKRCNRPPCECREVEVEITSVRKGRPHHVRPRDLVWRKRRWKMITDFKMRNRLPAIKYFYGRIHQYRHIRSLIKRGVIDPCNYSRLKPG